LIGSLVFAALVALGVAGCGAASIANTGDAGKSAREPVFEAEAVGPLTKVTQLQIVSVFSYEPGEQLLTPATEVASFLTDARVDKGYCREALRPLLVTPTPSSIKAGQLLVIAWGARSEFSVDRVKDVGRAAMRETIRMGVSDMAYAPIARDQGVTSLSADVVAAAFVEAALGELIDERAARAGDALALQHVTYEAGPQFVDAVSKAVARGVEAAHARRRR